ncbi:MAG: hypothetical protein KJT03_04735, partial [Verrucomicrobiae bacterium]|nr:hypothetical protein [Verrucomicrobiae bacterium]
MANPLINQSIMAESNFQKAIESLKNAIGDLSSLEVQTISGNLDGILTEDSTGDSEKPNSGGSVIDWEKAIKAAKTSGNIQLVLATKINFDGDATQFIRQGEIPQYMLDAHAE